MAHEGAIKRFGPRYGRTIKRNFSAIESSQRSLHVCPYCRAEKVKRMAVGIWNCKKCGATFTGKAYTVGKLRSLSETVSDNQVQESMESQAVKTEETAVVPISEVEV